MRTLILDAHYAGGETTDFNAVEITLTPQMEVRLSQWNEKASQLDVELPGFSSLEVEAEDCFEVVVQHEGQIYPAPVCSESHVFVFGGHGAVQCAGMVAGVYRFESVWVPLHTLLGG